jgi:hypothetical protein
MIGLLAVRTMASPPCGIVPMHFCANSTLGSSVSRSAEIKVLDTILGVPHFTTGSRNKTSSDLDQIYRMQNNYMALLNAQIIDNTADKNVR